MRKHRKIPDISKEDKERFLRKVNILSDEECWIWKGENSSRIQKNKNYPYFLLGSEQYTANRVSWTIFKSDIKSGLQILHTCDNKRCVNPNHLYQGTQSDNMGDVVSRHYYEINYKRRFNKEQISTMHSLRQSGETFDSIA